jgi:hypothetical protein
MRINKGYAMVKSSNVVFECTTREDVTFDNGYSFYRIYDPSDGVSGWISPFKIRTGSSKPRWERNGFIDESHMPFDAGVLFFKLKK